MSVSTTARTSAPTSPAPTPTPASGRPLQRLVVALRRTAPGARTGPRVGRCLLTTRDAGTGRPRTTVLPCLVRGDDLVVPGPLPASAAWAGPEHGSWRRDLAADPEVEVQLGLVVRRARARAAGSGDGAAVVLEGGARSWTHGM